MVVGSKLQVNPNINVDLLKFRYNSQRLGRIEISNYYFVY